MRCPHALLAAAALTLGACRVPDAAPGAFAPSTSVPGEVVQRDSGFAFPAQLGRFHRVALRQYDPAGRDVSAGYNCDFLQVVATIYVYPAVGRTLEQEFVRR